MKSIKILCLIVFSFFITSCNGQQDISNQELNNILNHSLTEYYVKKDNKILEKAYQNLQRNKDFREHGLVNGISFSTITVLMNLKKYDELEKLLVDNKILNQYNKQTILNTVRFLKYSPKDKQKGESYMQENLKLAQDTIKKSPKDSLLYGDYFSAQMFLKGKENTLKQIDSTFSQKSRYRKILKESIEIYPEELLPKK